MKKLWVDDERRPPSDDWVWCRTTNEATSAIVHYQRKYRKIANEPIIIDLDHDAGRWAFDGGDYIKILDWLEDIGYVDSNYSFHIHTMNPVGRQNMEAIIEHNGWRLIK